MSKIKGKQLADDSINLDKLKGGEKYLPKEAILGSNKSIADEDTVWDDNEFVTKEYVDNATANAVKTGSGIAIEEEKVVLDIKDYNDDDEISITTNNIQGMVLNAPNGSILTSGATITHLVEANGVDIHLELDGTSVELSATNIDDTKYASVDVDYDYVDINHQSGTGSEQIRLEDGINISTSSGNSVTITGESIKYAADYRSTYTDRSLVDKEYVSGMYSDSSSVVIDDSGTVSVRSPKSDQLNLIPLNVSSTTGYTGIEIAEQPKGIMFILLNGMISLVGDGVKTMPFFFTQDDGVTARNLVDIVTGDKLYYNPEVAGYDITTDDRISIMTI
jgi:hypothetical protein